MSDLKPRRLILIVLLISLLGGFFRFWGIGERSFWEGEFFSRDMAQSLGHWSTVQRLVDSGNTPLYFLVLKFWQTMGDTEAFLRTLSALCGTVTIPLVFILGISCLGTRSAVIGSFFMALSPFHIFWAQTVRPYTFLSLWMLVSLLCYLQAVQKDRTWGWVGYAVGSTLSLYTHYAGFSTVLIGGSHFLLNWRRFRKHRLFFLYTLLAIFLFFSPWLALLTWVLKGGGTQPFSRALHITYAGRLLKSAYIPFLFSLGGSVAPWALGVVIPAIVVFGGLLIRGVFSKKDRSSGLQFLLIMLLVPPFILIPFVPHVKAAHLLVLSTAYYLILGKGVLSFRALGFRATSLAAICLLFAISLYHYERQDSLHIHRTDTIVPWKKVDEIIKRDGMEGDLILFNHPEHLSIFKYYYKGDLETIPIVQSDLEGEIYRKIEGYDRAWLVLKDSQNQKERTALVRWMDSHYYLVSEKKYLKNHRVIAGLMDGNMKAHLYYALEIYLYDLKKQKSSVVERGSLISTAEGRF